MRVRPRLVPAVALLVVLAGCGTAPTGTPTDAAPERPDPTATPTPGPSFPAGLSADGVEDADALLDAHAAELNGTTHLSELVRTSNATTRVLPVNRSVYAGVVDGERRTLTRATGTAYPGAPVERWETPNVSARRALDDRPLYEVYRGGEVLPAVLTGDRAVLAPVLTDATWRYDGREPSNTSTLLRYEATGASGPLRSVEATLLVAPDGAIHGLEASYVRATADGDVAVEVRYDLTRAVAPPPTPDWVTDAPHLTAERAGSDAVAFTNAGDATLPAGTNLSVALAGEVRAVDRNGSLPVDLAPGETVYVSVVDGAEPTVQVTADRPDGPDLLNLTGSYVTVQRVGEVRVLVGVVPAGDDGG
jgi:hypothetical protein